MDQPAAHSATRQPSAWVWSGLAVLLLWVAGIRYRLLEIPLDRDEGEYAYFGQLMLQGVPPYALAYNMKLPGIYAAYAAIMSAFGQTLEAIHLGLLLVNLATTWIVFLLAKRICNELAGVSAAAIFAVLSLGPEMQGLAAKAEHFVMLFATAGLLLLLRSSDGNRSWNLVGSGLLLGSAFLMKQHAAAFCLAGWVHLCIVEFRRPSSGLALAARGLAPFTAALILPFLSTCALLFLAGVFPRFWMWTVEYAQSYTSQIPLSHVPTQLGFSLPRALSAGPLLWVLAGLGLVATCWRGFIRGHGAFIALTVFSSVLAVTPGLYFRPHYFLMVLPAAALLGGLAVSALESRLSDLRPGRLAAAAPLALLVVALVVSIAGQREFFFRMNPSQASRWVYGPNPFPESSVIGDYIRRHSGEDARVAVLGSEPQIYFYSGRRSATGYIYMYPLMEEHDRALSMQEELIREIEATEPEYMIFVRMDSSWLQFSQPNDRIFDWFDDYQESRYQRVGLIDLLPEGTQYHWAPELTWPPNSESWIAVLRRVDL